MADDEVRFPRPGVFRPGESDREVEAPRADLDTRTDEKVIGAPVVAPVQPPAAAPAAVDQIEDARPTALSGPASSTARASVQGALGILEANQQFARSGIDPVQFEKRLQEMAGEGLSPVAQERFIAYLESCRMTPEALAQVAGLVRQTLFDHHTSVRPLRKYLNARGIKLFENDKVKGPHVLDRKAFADTLAQIERNGGAATKRDARAILAMLQGVVDPKDLQYAQRQLERRGITFTEPAAAPYGAKLDEFFAEKLGGELNLKSFRAALDDARRSGFSPESLAALREQVAASAKHPQALFAARRALQQALAEAGNGASRDLRKAERTIAYLEGVLKAHPEDHPKKVELQAQIEALRGKLPELREKAAAGAQKVAAVVAATGVWFPASLDSCLDRHAARQEVRTQLAEGKITRNQAHALMSAVAVSNTQEELAARAAHLQVDAVLAEILAAMAEAWDAFAKDMQRALSDDEYDSSGKLVRTAQERHQERRVEESRVRETREASTTQRGRSREASFDRGAAASRAARSQANTVSEARAATAAETAFELAAQRAAPKPN